MQTRRQFIQRTTAAATLGYASHPLPASPVSMEWRNRHDSMSYRPLGRTGWMVSEIVMGGNEINPNNYKHVIQALDRGLNYLDTAPAYGRGQSELGFAKVIREVGRDRFFLNSKISLWDNQRNQTFYSIFNELDDGTQKTLLRKRDEQIQLKQAADPNYLVQYFGSQKKELESAVLANVMEKDYGHRIDRQKNYGQLILDSVDASLQRLGTDHLDIVMCPHGASSEEELLYYPEIGEAFEQLKSAGKVRHLGVSSHSDPAGVLRGAIKSGIYSVAMVAYNMVNHPFMAETLRQAREKGIGVIAMKVARPVFPGPGRGTVDPARIERLHAAIPGAWSIPQKAYLWALRNPDLSAAISNMVNANQVRDNLILPEALRSA